MQVTLQRKSWLLREWEVTTPQGAYVVTYSGRGHGYESVAVNNQVVAKAGSPTWFVPRFVFLLGDSFAKVEVRVWPWLALRGIHLRIGGVLHYREGRFKAPTPVRRMPARVFLVAGDPIPRCAVEYAEPA